MRNQKKIININSRKYDGKIHRSWKAEFIEQKNSLITFVGEFDQEVIHTHLGVIRRGTVSYEYYWLNRWYNIFRFHEPDGSLRNFYCNINMPPTFENDIINYVDLDVDILVWKDFSFEVLDLEEFKENSIKFNYSQEIYKETFKSLEELKTMIEKRLFPFSDFILE